MKLTDQPKDLVKAVQEVIKTSTPTANEKAKDVSDKLSARYESMRPKQLKEYLQPGPDGRPVPPHGEKADREFRRQQAIDLAQDRRDAAALKNAEVDANRPIGAMTQKEIDLRNKARGNIDMNRPMDATGRAKKLKEEQKNLEPTKIEKRPGLTIRHYKSGKDLAIDKPEAVNPEDIESEMVSMGVSKKDAKQEADKYRAATGMYPNVSPKKSSQQMSAAPKQPAKVSTSKTSIRGTPSTEFSTGGEDQPTTTAKPQQEPRIGGKAAGKPTPVPPAPKQTSEPEKKPSKLATVQAEPIEVPKTDTTEPKLAELPKVEPVKAKAEEPKTAEAEPTKIGKIEAVS